MICKDPQTEKQYLELLRDEFALKWLGNFSQINLVVTGADIANECYMIADEMLKAREKK